MDNYDKVHLQNSVKTKRISNLKKIIPSINNPSKLQKAIAGLNSVLQLTGFLVFQGVSSGTTVGMGVVQLIGFLFSINPIIGFASIVPGILWIRPYIEHYIIGEEFLYYNPLDLGLFIAELENKVEAERRLEIEEGQKLLGPALGVGDTRLVAVFKTYRQEIEQVDKYYIDYVKEIHVKFWKPIATVFEYLASWRRTLLNNLAASGFKQGVSSTVQTETEEYEKLHPPNVDKKQITPGRDVVQR